MVGREDGDEGRKGWSVEASPSHSGFTAATSTGASALNYNLLDILSFIA